MLDHPHHVIAAFIGVATILLALWIEGGLAGALLGAALIDLGVTLLGRHRQRSTAAARGERQKS